MPNNILKNPPFWCFASFLIVSLTHFINNPDSTRDWIIFMVSLEIINVVVPDPNIFSWIAASAADAAAVNPNGIKTLLANGLILFRSKGNPAVSNGPKILLQNHPDCPILCNWVFDKFISAEGLLAKALRSLETCVLVNNKLCRKVFSSLESPTTFDEIFKVTLVLTFIPDFKLLSCELDNFILVLY